MDPLGQARRPYRGRLGRVNDEPTTRLFASLPPLADVLLTTTSPAQDAMFRTRAATLVVLEELLDAVAAHLRRDRHFRTRSAVTPSTSYENVYLDG